MSHLKLQVHGAAVGLQQPLDSILVLFSKPAGQLCERRQHVPSRRAVTVMVLRRTGPDRINNAKNDPRKIMTTQQSPFSESRSKKNIRIRRTLKNKLGKYVLALAATRKKEKKHL